LYRYVDNNKIFNKLKTRNQVGWSLSFDNIGERFEYVRHGGSWELLQRNLDQLEPLMEHQRHWGGIHAVYNLYNATRLTELTKFARSRGLTIHWQSLYQPECLDPSRLGPQTHELAIQEIQQLLSSDICLSNEREFFDAVLAKQNCQDNLQSQFQQHISEIEQKYHKDQTGNFVRLWPELAHLVEPA
jgi:hypothetical protein